MVEYHRFLMALSVRPGIILAMRDHCRRAEGSVNVGELAADKTVQASEEGDRHLIAQLPVELEDGCVLLMGPVGLADLSGVAATMYNRPWKQSNLRPCLNQRRCGPNKLIDILYREPCAS